MKITKGILICWTLLSFGISNFIIMGFQEGQIKELKSIITLHKKQELDLEKKYDDLKDRLSRALPGGAFIEEPKGDAAENFNPEELARKLK